MHPTDDVHARGSLAVARAAAITAVGRAATAPNYHAFVAAMDVANKAWREVERIRALAASDAALARAIDAVSGRG